VYAGDYRDGLDAVDRDGCVPVPSGVGLGVEHDWEWLRAHEVDSVSFD
jgi:L-alanine-DL-glutamate epimerase-like enolase superfamily enzyme